MIGRPTEITRRCKAYKDGEISFDELKDYLVNRIYPDQRRLSEGPQDPVERARQGAAGNWDPDRNEMGTFDEVVYNRYGLGNLTSDEFLAINAAAYRAGRARQGAKAPELNGKRVRARVSNWAEVQANNQLDEVDPSLPSYEGLAEFVTGVLHVHDVNLPPRKVFAQHSRVLALRRNRFAPREGPDPMT